MASSMVVGENQDSEIEPGHGYELTQLLGGK